MIPIDTHMHLWNGPLRTVWRRTSRLDYRPTYHAHQGMELLFVHEGSGRAVVDRQVVEVQPGTLLVFQPFQLHSLHMETDENTAYTRSYFVFEPTVFDPYLQPFHALKTFYGHLWKGGLSVPAIRTRTAAPLLEPLIDDWARRDASAGGEEGDQAAREEQFAVFLVSFLQALQPAWQGRERFMEEECAELRTSPHVERILQWIEAHYNEPFRLDKLAGDVHLSPKHVSALFTTMVDSSITNYIISRRMRQACLLLRSGSLPVRDIAWEVGLSNVSYFCQLFKHTIGVSPYQYRKQAKASFNK